MLRMRMFPCTLLDPVAFLPALCGVVRQEALGSDLRRMKGRKIGRLEEWKDGTEERKSRLSEADGKGRRDRVLRSDWSNVLWFCFCAATSRFAADCLGGLIHRNIAEGYCRRSLKEYLPLFHSSLLPR